MTDKLDIEAALERSLRKQIVAPKLERRFDAAVWSKIEGEQQLAFAPAGKSRAEKLSRWLFISNVVGVTVAVVLACYFGLRSFAGMDLGMSVSMPAVSASTFGFVISGIGYLLTLVALGFAASLTSFGRRIRAEFS